MHRRESIISQRSFPATCQYVQSEFFPRLKGMGVGAMIQLLPPRIVSNEPRRFEMVKILEKGMALRIEVQEDNEGRVYVTVSSQLGMTINIIAGVIIAIITCGVAALIVAPLIYWKYSRWNTNIQKAVNLLRADLSA